MKDDRAMDDISRIINTHDPMGLIELGYPLNEYHTEAEFIKKKTESPLTLKQTEKMVLAHFKDAFDTLTFFQKIRLRQLSKDVYRYRASKKK